MLRASLSVYTRAHIQRLGDATRRERLSLPLFHTAHAPRPRPYTQMPPPTFFLPAGAAPQGSWPHDGPAPAGSVALLLIDLQHDFISDTGYFASCGGGRVQAECHSL
jgi:hypothetical protein